MPTRRDLIASGLLLGGLAVAMSARAQSAAERGTQLAREASNRQSGFQDISVQGEMILRSQGGHESVRRFDSSWLSIAPGETRTLLVFRWPGDIRNTALLTHAYSDRRDDQWLYLPAMERVRRISGSGRSGSFVGSEFAYEDMADQEVSKYTHVWIRDEANPAGRCHVIERSPQNRSGYSLQRIWLDIAELRLQQVQYFDRGGAHLKTLTLSDYRRYNGRFWRAGRMDMVNHLVGSSTRLIWDGYVFDQGLNPNAFSVNALRRI